MLFWFFIILKCINFFNWDKIFVFYDNMCYLDGLKVVEVFLFWFFFWDKVWMLVKKIIDSLYIRNYKDKSCKEKYDLVMLKEEFFDGNIMVVE